MTQIAKRHGDQSPDANIAVTVVMPVYNAASYLAEAIDSIIHQTYARWEMIVVIDGGSSDASQAIAEAYAARDSRIQICFSDHHGLSETLNAGIAAATGEYIALCDADDIASPERLRVQLQWMCTMSLDLGGGCAQCFDGSDMVLWFPEDHATIQMDLLFRASLLPSTVMARACVLKENPYTPGVAFQDYDLWTRLATRYRLGNMQHVLARHRVHDQQISRVLADRNCEDKKRSRKPYFFSLFAGADESDYASFARLADELPHTDLDDLRRAGSWIVCFAQPSDPFHRQRLERRWLAACRRSAHLGPECYQVYRRVAGAFRDDGAADDLSLRLMCASRIGSNSRLAGFARQVRSLRWRRRHAAA